MSQHVPGAGLAGVPCTPEQGLEKWWGWHGFAPGAARHVLQASISGPPRVALREDPRPAVAFIFSVLECRGLAAAVQGVIYRDAEGGPVFSLVAEHFWEQGLAALQLGHILAGSHYSSGVPRASGSSKCLLSARERAGGQDSVLFLYVAWCARTRG